jgi:hypothetical protein
LPNILRQPFSFTRARQELTVKAGELKALAIDWLASTYPGSLIVPELSIGTWGAALLDVAAVTESEIIGVEIKGEGDSPARLPLQAAIYSKAATRMFLLPCPELEERCFKRIPDAWGRLTARSGIIVPALDEWDRPKLAKRLCTAPAQLLQCLWRDELDAIARDEAIITGKADVETLRWELAERIPLEKLREHVCYALRHRRWNTDRGSKHTIWAAKAEAA